ncbi:cytokine-like protein 1 isoform X1 [Alosa sapidissima]|uniref:cytokine-like protein 1 isoform X1 n=1 Tax=Alosa sapidissima TaxID=34773 RepID=UPI001C086413|nr:cytokine-like protein 1 isoform X1 [Alosa sapidissima]
MKVGLATLIVAVTYVWIAESAPPTCYSRVLGLSKEIMDTLHKLHKHHRTKDCAEVLPKLFIDVHDSCVMPKLRDFLYVVENLPTPQCRARPRVTVLQRKVRNLYTIINRVCYRDLVYFTDDCEAIETGHSSPRYGEDRLQLLEEN